MKRRYGRSEKLLALAAAFILLLGSVGAHGVAAEEKGSLPDAFWNYLTENAEKGVAVVDVSQFNIVYSPEMKKAISSFLFYEKEELFHVQAPIGFAISGEMLTAVALNYNCTASEYAARLKEVRSAAAGLLNGIRGNNALSDVQKALLLHDRLAVHCEYDTGVYTSAGAGADARDIYGALVERRAVCEGYTRAYAYLLRQVGIRSVINSSDTLNHTWNLVYIDGEPYHVDVTFDDPADDKTGRVAHNHFLLSSAAFRSIGHAADDYDTSPTDTRYDNAFWRNSYAAFVLADGVVYYIDHAAQTLNRYDRQKLLVLSDDWDGWYEIEKKTEIYCLARLATNGRVLLYNDSRSVWAYDPASGKTEKVFTPPDPSGQKLIFGMTWENGTIFCDFTDSPGNYAAGKNSFLVTKAYAAAVPAALPGDVDGDGWVSSGDARLALRCSVGLEEYAAGSAAFKACDVDGDRKVTSADARLILRASVGLEKL